MLGHVMRIKDLQKDALDSGSGIAEFFKLESERCGDAFTFELLGLSCFFLNDPSMIAEFTQKKAKNFEERFVSSLVAYAYTETDVRHEGFRRTTKSGRDDVAGLVFTRGERWKKFRNLASQALQQKSSQDRLQRIVCNKANAFVGRWRKAGRALEDGVRVDTEAQRYTVDVIGEVALSHDFRQLEEDYETSQGSKSEFARNTDRALHLLNSMIIKDPLRLWRWLETPYKAEFFDKNLWLARFEDRLIQSRKEALARSDVPPDDFLGILLQARDEDGTPLSAREIRWATHDMFIAGNDTTTSTIAAALALLALHPDVQRKVLEECKDVLRGGPVVPEKVQQLQYTEAVVREVLRLYPAAHLFGRRCSVGPESIGPYTVDAGTILFASPFVLHRTERFWPEPLSFMPSRFLPGGCWEGVGGSTPKLAWMPFGNGARSCIGGMLALLEAKAAVAALVQEFQLEVLPMDAGSTGIRKDGSLVINYDVTMGFPEGLLIKAQRRELGNVRGPESC